MAVVPEEKVIAGSSGGARVQPSSGYSRRYQIGLLCALLIVNIFNLMDRSLFGILGESIKHDLALTDSQLGLVGGAAFIIVYNLFALPMAGLADRGMRKRVILWSILIWCSMTGLVAFITNFWQLVVARMGVAVGEAGVSPASQALVSTQVSVRRRGFAIGILLFGGAAGAAAAPLLGGWAHDLVGWRGTFMLFGPVGLLLIPLTMLLVREHRSDADTIGAPEAKSPRVSVGQTIRYLAGIPPYRLLWVSSALLFFAPSTYLTYAGPFFIRTFGLSAGEAGRHLGLAFGIGSVGGGLLGGVLYDYFGRNSARMALKVPAVGAAVAAVIAVFGWLSGSIAVTSSCFVISLFLCSWVNAPTYATAQVLAPISMRSTSAALCNLGLGLGGAVGPLVTGILSDALQPSRGIHSLGPALAVAAAVQLIGALVLLRVGYAIKPEFLRA
jgi:MFS transporter, Spinster family, sphingosine-1-phosphate transporter